MNSRPVSSSPKSSPSPKNISSPKNKQLATVSNYARSKSSQESSLNKQKIVIVSHEKWQPLRKLLTVSPPSSATKKPSTRLKPVPTNLSPKPLSNFAQRIAKSRQPEVVVSPKEIRQLTSKFEALSATIVRLATSSSPVSVPSLESLLAKEVTSCLGSTINSAKFAHIFVRETRRILESLNCKFEEGKVNTQLIKSHNTSSRTFLKANSATTICYRDRYLKELLMNVLQDMCSPSMDKQRKSALRTLLRSEAGFVPETFIHAEREMDVLQRTLSRSRVEVQAASRELDELISDHRMRQIDTDKPQRDSDEVKGDFCEETTKKGEHVPNVVGNISVKETSPKTQKTQLKKIKVEDGGGCQEKLKSVVNPGCSMSDPIESIRPLVNEIVREEISRAKERAQVVLNQIKELSDDDDDELSDIVASDSETYDDTDDEINEQETLEFLKALKADEQHLINSMAFGKIAELEQLEGKIDEAIDYRPIPHFHNEVRKVRLILDADEQSKSCLNHASAQNFRKVSQACVEPDKFKHNVDKSYVPTITEEEYDDVDKNGTVETDGNKLHGVRSVWWNAFDTEAYQVIQQMKTAMNAFDNTNHRPEKVSVRENNDFIDDDDEECNEGSYWTRNDLTVDEIANILKNLSTKVLQLSLKEEHRCSDFNGSHFLLPCSDKNQLIDILAWLESSLDSSFLLDKDLSNSNKGNKDWFSSTKTKVSNAFRMISETLHQAPSKLKSQPISIFAPPQSLTNTLAILASTDYFRDCFISGILEVGRRKPDMKSRNNVSERTTNNNVLLGHDEGDHCKIEGLKNDDFEVVKPISLGEQMSSRDVITSLNPETNSIPSKIKLNLAIRRFDKELTNTSNIHNYTTKYEHYIGLSTSIMSVRNVSDMFMFLSTVLNNVPERMKTERISSLDPPKTLISALDIIYNSEDGGFFLENTTNFTSVTVQDVSNLFLGLSMSFKNLPDCKKDSPIADLDPPKFLLDAINLLTSLANNSIMESKSEEQEEGKIGVCQKNKSQENYFDALDTSSYFKDELPLR